MCNIFLNSKNVHANKPKKFFAAPQKIYKQEVSKTNPDRYLVRGRTSDDIKILWVFELKNEILTGKVISIYPIIE